MIEIAGVTIAWETILWIGAFAASEVIGASRLKENGVLAIAKNIVDKMRPHRKEDDKVVAIRARIEALTKELENLGK